MSERVVRQKMSSLWLRQLQREHAEICFQYRLSLQPPVIAISSGHKQLGSWHPDRRLLAISEHLIREYPWQVTLQVFKHEMAHQICSEIWGEKQANHGATFRKACSTLGVEATFSHAQADCASSLPRLAVASEPTEKGRRAIERVTKLLALAGSDNEHEAALAMQRATELLACYNLDAVATPSRGDFCHCILNTGRKQIPAWRRAIVAILSEYFFVRVVCGSLYDPLTDTCHATIELLGRPGNVPVAEHCYHFLEHRLAQLYGDNRHRLSGHPRTARNSYYLGLLAGFRQKMAEHEQAGPQPDPSALQTSTALLVLAKDRELQDFVNSRFPRLQPVARRSSRIYRETYKEAVAQGRTIVLHQSIVEKKTDQATLCIIEGEYLQGRPKNLL